MLIFISLLSAVLKNNISVYAQHKQIASIKKGAAFEYFKIGQRINIIIYLNREKYKGNIIDRDMPIYSVSGDEIGRAHQEILLKEINFAKVNGFKGDKTYYLLEGYIKDKLEDVVDLDLSFHNALISYLVAEKVQLDDFKEFFKKFSFWIDKSLENKNILIYKAKNYSFFPENFDSFTYLFFNKDSSRLLLVYGFQELTPLRASLLNVFEGRVVLEDYYPLYKFNEKEDLYIFDKDNFYRNDLVVWPVAINFQSAQDIQALQDIYSYLQTIYKATSSLGKISDHEDNYLQF